MSFSSWTRNLLRRPHFYFSIAFLVALFGFWPSFFSKLSTTDSAHVIHGVTATRWMTVPILQSWLITHHRFALHRRLGWASLIVLAPLLVISGLHMVQLMIVRYQQTNAIRLLKFAFLDISAMTLTATRATWRVLCSSRWNRHWSGFSCFTFPESLDLPLRYISHLSRWR